MRRRLLRKLERDLLRVRQLRLLVQVEVALHLLAFLPQQQRQEVTRTKAPPEPRPQPGVEGRAGPPHGVPVLGQQLLPDLDVPLLDAGELDVDLFAVGIALLAGEGKVEEGCVGLILPVMEPFVEIRLWRDWGLGGLWHAASYYSVII